MTTYFKLLSSSSLFFLEQAKLHRNNIKLHRYYALSSLIQSWLLLEAYVNHVSDVLSAGKLDIFEKAILSHKGLRITDDGEIVEVNFHLSTLKRIIFILNNFSRINTKKIRKSKLWSGITAAEDFRNQIIHPKQLKIQKLNSKSAEKTHESVIALIKKINTSIFHKQINLN